MNDEIIPKLRNDIQLMLIEQDGHNYVVMADRLGYAKEEIAVSLEFYDLLISLGDKTKYSELSNILQIEDSLIIEQVVNNINRIDDLGFLFSNSFKKLRDYENKEYLALVNRPYICALNSYPEDKDLLQSFLSGLYHSVNSDDYTSDCSAIIVPHIDLRLKEEAHQAYAAAYHSAKNTDFDLIVILGTAHYDSSSLFMLSEKNYSTPLGVANTDFELIELWKSLSSIAIETNEFAHKPEHSIEYQILLSQYFFKDKDFKVLPILVGSFHEYFENRESPDSSVTFLQLIESLQKALHISGRKPLFIASVDLAHIGRKFGDDFDAAPALSNLRFEDRKLIDSIERLDKESFFQKILDDNDKYKICGTSPIYSLLSLNNFNKASFLKYNQWNDIETKSAVSFASFAFYN